MLASSWMVDAMRVRAERGKAYGQAIGPIRTGRYVGLIDVQPGGFHVAAGLKDGHAHAMYAATAPYSIFLEKGTKYMAAQHVLLRSIDGMRD